jgi:hypothetical protein
MNTKGIALALLALLLIAATPLPSNQPQTQIKPSSDQKNNRSAPVFSDGDQAGHKGTHNAGNSYAYNYYYPTGKSESPPVRFQEAATFILIIFTGGLWITSIWQWRAIDRQADALDKSLTVAEKAANAATKSADAERGWIAFNLGTISGMEDLVKWRGDLESFNQNMTIQHTLSTDHAFVNGGKTIGRVNGGIVKFVSGNPDDLPVEPNYGGPDVVKVPEFLILPNVPVKGAAYLPMVWGEITQLLNSDCALIIYGFISYQDIWNNPHESRFCLICRIPKAWPVPLSFSPSGPDAYNRYT